jgi:hypothetical protein
VMRSVKESNSTAAYLTVAIVIIVQLVAEAGRTQELPPPRIDEEIIKQEKIYRSRGSDVPRGYVTDRGLTDYAELLPTGFCEALGGLGSSDRWLDIGAGSGQAILDYYAPKDDEAAGKKCAGPGDKARAVAMSIEDRRTDAWQQQAEQLGDDRIRYLSGKRLREYSPEELGNSRSLPTCSAAFPIPKTCPSSWRRC